LNIEVKIGIEKAQGSSGFYESIPEMMLCGTDDKVPGIKNGGRIAVIEAGLQNQMVQVRAHQIPTRLYISTLILALLRQRHSQ
jgi:hypothetical protein